MIAFTAAALAGPVREGRREPALVRRELVRAVQQPVDSPAEPGVEVMVVKAERPSEWVETEARVSAGQGCRQAGRAEHLPAVWVPEVMAVLAEHSLARAARASASAEV